LSRKNYLNGAFQEAELLFCGLEVGARVGRPVFLEGEFFVKTGKKDTLIYIMQNTFTRKFYIAIRIAKIAMMK
jgi:hypothetical protein